MNDTDRVAVCSRSFSRNETLRSKLLERYRNVTFNDAGAQLQGDSLVEFLSGHSKAITALERLDESVLSRLPGLKVVGKYGVGLDMIDVAAMRAQGKRLGWTAGVNRRSVAELALAFALMMLREIPSCNREVLSGTWRQRIGRQLSESTVGIIGCGHIGKELVRMLQPFGCRILVNDIAPDRTLFAEHRLEEVALGELLRSADVVSLHVPLDATTAGMLGADALAAMKHSSVLINTARGGLVDEAALKRLLAGGKIAGAAFDVFADEPPADRELLELPNFYATAHIGGSSTEAILAMGIAAINGLDENSVP